MTGKNWDARWMLFTGANFHFVIMAAGTSADDAFAKGRCIKKGIEESW